MKWTDQQIQNVRNISIAEQLGVDPGRRVKVCCPMPNHLHEKTPSFLIDQDNGYKCFGCGVYGNGFIDFCSEILRETGVEDTEIFPQIMQTYGTSNN